MPVYTGPFSSERCPTFSEECVISCISRPVDDDLIITARPDKWRFTPYGFGYPGWNASLMTWHHLPGWWYGIRFRLAKCQVQRDWLVHQSASVAVKWRSLLNMPSFSGRPYARCMNLLLAIRFECCADNFFGTLLHF